MNTLLLVSPDFDRVCAYINRIYDEEFFVLTTEMLWTHISDHLYTLVNRIEDPDPILTELLFGGTDLLYTHVPVIIPHPVHRVVGDNGMTCDFPMVILVECVYYEHFYRQNA